MTAPQPCHVCSGRGVISFGPDDLKCDECNGTGHASGRGRETEVAKEVLEDVDAEA